jgi:hypothetical protein
MCVSRGTAFSWRNIRDHFYSHNPFILYNTFYRCVTGVKMRYFTIIDFQDMTLAFFLWFFALILVYVSWSGYSRLRDDKELGRDDDAELISSHGHNRMAPILIIIYAGAALWAIIYLVFFGIKGGPIG